MQKDLSNAQVTAGSPHPLTGQRLMSLRDVADYLQVSTRTVKRRLESEGFPQPFKVGGSNRWYFAHVDQWAARRSAVVNPGIGDSNAKNEEHDQMDATVQVTQLSGASSEATQRQNQSPPKRTTRFKPPKRTDRQFPPPIAITVPQGRNGSDHL